ncbi:MAG: primosomal protein N', partial [Calditrichales bacterium]
VVDTSDLEPDIRCKDIIDVLDEQPLISGEMLDLTKWMADYYMAGWGQALQLALPRGLDKKSNITLQPANGDMIEAAALTGKQRHLLDLIYADPGKTTSQYKKKFGTGSFDYTVRVLIKKDIVIPHKQLSAERVRKQLTRHVILAADVCDRLSVLRQGELLKPVLEPLAGKSLPYKQFMEETGLSAARIKTMFSHNLLEFDHSENFRLYEQGYSEVKKTITLNSDQQAVLSAIEKQTTKKKFKVFLLNGVTGSGKTQVYMESIQKVLEKNRSAIVLIPEISLTPQTVSRFENFFPGKTFVFHSRMGLGERYDTWRKIAQSGPCIAIGPRSALFLPVKDLGIIVVDEEHDGSYKQEGQAPRYHARDTAIYRAMMNDAVVILGSATPSMESTYNSHKGKFELLSMENRIAGLELPEIHIVDSKKIMQGSGASKILSTLLIEKIAKRIEENEQCILLQNRRGFSSYLQCEECGHTTKCPNCDIHLTYHTSSYSTQCHYCGFTINASHNCPKCQGVQIRYVGVGTQQIELELERLFPGVRILRMDVDTTSARGAHEKILQRFKDGKADILLGTQMIAKGLDFEKVSLVGVVSADIGLTLPDFRSSERVFQLLTQVAGRSGRSGKRGEVVIQTGMETHYTLQYARNHDYYGFYKAEIIFRGNTGYPPFARLIKIGVNAINAAKANKTATEIVRTLHNLRQSYYKVIGPAPAPMVRLNNRYRWQILLKIDQQKDPSGTNTRRIIREKLDPFLSKKSDDIIVNLDIDPMDMM